MIRRTIRCTIASLALATALTLPAAATTFKDAGHGVQHVLLISVDGLHAEDLALFAKANPGSTLAKLVARGTVYGRAMTPAPADSFPGLLSFLTGGTPKSTGVLYDDSFDRALSPAASNCTEKGAEVVFDEAASKDEKDVNTTIDEAKLPRDPANGCKPFYPHQYLRVNTVFEVIKAAGGRTAWADKHPAYDLVNGPSGKGVDDLFVPEIAAGDVTDSVAKTEAYDDTKVAAVLNEIAGHDHTGTAAAPVSTILGLNFQAVSVAQKLKGVGYKDARFTPSDGLAEALAHTDASIGKISDALLKAGIADKTFVILSAKHGQSPVDPSLRKILDKKALTKAIEAAAPGGVAHTTYDTAAYIWLKNQAEAPAVAKMLQDRKAEFSVAKVYEGATLTEFFNDPKTDGRMPDVMMQPVAGVIITKASASKIAEHGGSLTLDRHVALVVAGPGVNTLKIDAPVSTTSVAPTILGVLGLDPAALDAVKAEGTQPLPG
ncbi:MAG: alkaline phosphatase family protein, partial [Ancalomicrobiaceae bacterium]|nr:alkaline phosphatase family protein [Ancalomicrobiaceae bacterium]